MAAAPPPRPFRSGLLKASCVPPASALAVLAVWAALGRPWGWAGLLGIPALGLAWAWAWVSAVSARLGAGLGAVDEAARVLAAGRFDGLAFPEQAALLGGTPELLGRAAAALRAREQASRSFGPDVEPAQGAAWLDSLDGPAEARPVAVLAARWLDADFRLAALEPAARQGMLGRFYECVLEVIRRDGGTVLELGGGQVLGVWGAPVSPSPKPPNPVVPAPQRLGESLLPSPLNVAPVLHAAWQLRSRLTVLSSQHRLRQGSALEWSLALATGPAVSGAWGPRSHRRWAVSGAPLAEVRRLGAQPGGPWLAADTAAQVGVPYGIGIVDGLPVLAAGPE